jgi:hypothetical protein
MRSVTSVDPETVIGVEAIDIQLNGIAVAGSVQTGLPFCVCKPVMTGLTPDPLRLTVAAKS